MVRYQTDKRWEAWWWPGLRWGSRSGGTRHGRERACVRCVRDAVARSQRFVRGLEKGVGRVGLLWDSGEGDTTLVEDRNGG